MDLAKHLQKRSLTDGTHILGCIAAKHIGSRLNQLELAVFSDKKRTDMLCAIIEDVGQGGLDINPLHDLLMFAAVINSADMLLACTSVRT